MLVRFLHAAARRRIVAGRGEAEHGAIGKFDRHLHQTLAERAAAHDDGTVVVLHGPGEDFACRGRGFVHQHHERQVLVCPATVGAVFAAFRLAALRVDDERIFREKLVGN